MKVTTSNQRTGVCRPKGFKAAGIAAGIKASGKKDLAVIVSDTMAVPAAVFTRNRVKAAPVIVSQKHLKEHKVRAIVISSGNANAATGEDGIKAAEEMCRAAADVLNCRPEEILIAQTGLIGIPLNRTVAVTGTGRSASQCSFEGGADAAEAIMTTDTKPKTETAVFTQEGREVTVGGIAKGAAMLAPSMATMIACLTTDAHVTQPVLQCALSAAMENSFHAMTVDSCMSTNDTVFIIANGLAGTPEIDSLSHPAYADLEKAITEVCVSLARQMAGDGEGATKFLIMNVHGAASLEDARKAARTVVGSLLVKCSLAGENAYWGRVIAELGASGADFDPSRVEISYGPYVVCKNGMAYDLHNDAAQNYMKKREIVINASLDNGDFSATAYGCDLTHAYVDENMGKS